MTLGAMELLIFICNLIILGTFCALEWSYFSYSAEEAVTGAWILIAGYSIICIVASIICLTTHLPDEPYEKYDVNIYNKETNALIKSYKEVVEFEENDDGTVKFVEPHTYDKNDYYIAIQESGKSK